NARRLFQLLKILQQRGSRQATQIGVVADHSVATEKRAHVRAVSAHHAGHRRVGRRGPLQRDKNGGGQPNSVAATNFAHDRSPQGHGHYMAAYYRPHLGFGALSPMELDPQRTNKTSTAD